MQKVKLVMMFMLMFALILTGCGLSKIDVLEKLVSKNEGQLVMRIFSDEDFSYEINKVYNSEPKLLKHIQDVVIYAEDEKLKWLKKLGVEARRPVIIIFDTEKIVFNTNDPEELREFAQTLEK